MTTGFAGCGSPLLAGTTLQVVGALRQTEGHVGYSCSRGGSGREEAFHLRFAIGFTRARAEARGQPRATEDVTFKQKRAARRVREASEGSG